jgi:beta-phosphoglucomutase-like phosphatase (HAD superfamily)
MNAPIGPPRHDAVLFDLDGVLTATAAVHAAAWKRAFDEFLVEWTQCGLGPQAAFSVQHDYVAYVDGKPREDGVRAFMASRGIKLPEGQPGDPWSVRGIAERKQAFVEEVLERDGVEAFPARSAGSTICCGRGRARPSSRRAPTVRRCCAQPGSTSCSS